MNITKLKKPDGSIGDFIKLSHAKEIFLNSSISFNTFTTYIVAGKIPSVKLGSSRMVEYEIAINFSKKLNQDIPIFTGYQKNGGEPE